MKKIIAMLLLLSFVLVGTVGCTGGETKKDKETAKKEEKKTGDTAKKEEKK